MKTKLDGNAWVVAHCKIGHTVHAKSKLFIIRVDVDPINPVDSLPMVVVFADVFIINSDIDVSIRVLVFNELPRINAYLSRLCNFKVKYSWGLFLDNESYLLI